MKYRPPRMELPETYIVQSELQRLKPLGKNMGSSPMGLGYCNNAGGWPTILAVKVGERKSNHPIAGLNSLVEFKKTMPCMTGSLARRNLNGGNR